MMVTTALAASSLKQTDQTSAEEKASVPRVEVQHACEVLPRPPRRPGGPGVTRDTNQALAPSTHVWIENRGGSAEVNGTLDLL